MSEPIFRISRLNAIVAKSERNLLVIPYLISMVFVAVSIDSVARGIDNGEAWRIITAGIGGSFFLFLAIVTAIKLIRLKELKKKRPGVLSRK